MHKEDIVTNLQDYMFTLDNLSAFTKHMIQHKIKPKQHLIVTNDARETQEEYKETQEDYKETQREYKETDNVNRKHQIIVTNNNKIQKEDNEVKRKPQLTKNVMYKPKQKDSLFWCFYILRNGYSNYEMEINNQYFVVEKKEKFKYIDMLRNNKDILKLHKIRPFTELEDDLANKDKITVKTFFALCIVENINVLLVDKRKIFELTCVDIDEEHIVNIIHRNSQTGEHQIELDTTNDILQKYRETYHKMSSFDSTIKSMGTYKLDELLDLCNKLNIDTEFNNENTKKKKTKKDIYELLVSNY
jgi:hypothetical protein